MNYCAGCGKELPMGSRFCPACGRAVHYANAVPTTNFDGIVRPRVGRKIGGVCLALSKRYGWDLALVRVATVLIGLFTFPLGVIAYCILWAVLPEEPYLLKDTTSTPQGAGGTVGV